MTDFLELIPIDFPPFFDTTTEVTMNEMLQGRQDKRATTPVLLRSIRSSLGSLWLPSYLPNGFDADLAEVTNIDNRQHPDLIFRTSSQIEEEHGGQLILSVDRADQHKHEFVPSNSESYYTSVVVDSRKGILIRGGWLIELNEDDTVKHSGWELNHTCRLVLEDLNHNQVITIEARPASVVTEDELLRIAGSLQLSQIHRSWLPWLRGR